MKGPFRNKQGSSLLEIVVAIAVLGLMVAPVCSSLVLSHRLNADSEKTLQARLLVESTVEQLMAEGIRYEKDKNGVYPSENEKYLIANEIDDTVIVTTGFDPYEKDSNGEYIYENGNKVEAELPLWYDVVVEVDGVEDVRVVTVVKAAPVVEDVPDAKPDNPEGGGA